MKKTQDRIHRFIQILAEQLHDQLSPSQEAEALNSSSESLQILLQFSIQDLPDFSLKKSLLRNDRLYEFLQLLRQNLQKLRTPKKLLLQSKEERINVVKEEVNGFIKDFREGTLEGGDAFRKMFGEMVQTIDDPPLELLWSFAAVKLMERKSKTGDLVTDESNPTTRVSLSDDLNFKLSVAGDLFRCLTACTLGQSCSASVSRAALVPVIVILSEAITKMSVYSELSAKRDNCTLSSCDLLLSAKSSGSRTLSRGEKSAMKSLKNLAGDIVGYLAVCGNKKENFNLEINLGRALPCCAALLSILNVWEHEKGVKFSVQKDLKAIFPLASAGIQATLLEEDCMVEYLGSVVTVESFLLQFVIEVIYQSLVSKKDCSNVVRDEGLRQILRMLAVNCIATVKNLNFYDILLELLLDSCLPDVFLVSQEEKVLLRCVLYEATSLVDYAFLKQCREHVSNEGKSLGDKSTRIFLNRFIVAHKAVQLFRSLGERSWAVSFSKTFINIPIPSDLMKWISNQRSELKNFEALIRNPQTNAGFLVNLDDERRLKQILNKHPVFNTTELPTENKHTNLESNAETIGLLSNLNASKEIEDDLFFIDTRGQDGEEKESDELRSVGKSFVIAARNMGNSIENDGNNRKKRKRNKKTKISFQRHIQLDASVKENRMQDFASDLSASEESDFESAGISDQPKNSRTVA